MFAPLDKDVHVKYPFWYTTGSTFFGVPTKNTITTTCRNVISGNTGDNSWTVDVVWDENPIGLNTTLSGYTSNKYTGVKNFLGYTKSSGQTYNTGTTIYDNTTTPATPTVNGNNRPKTIKGLPTFRTSEKLNPAK